MKALSKLFKNSFLTGALFLILGPLFPQSSFQRLTPSFVLDSGIFEGKVFNDLYTQNAAFDAKRMRAPLGRRSSFLNSIGQFLYGWNDRIDLGLEVWGSSVRIGDADRSPFHLLQGGPGMGRRTALTYLGPRVKFAPFQKHSNTSMEVTLLAPIAPDLEGRNRGAPYLADDRYSLIIKTFYDLEITNTFRLFLRLAPWLSIDRDGDRADSYLSSPLSGFLSYIPHPRLTIYSQSEWWPTYGNAPLINSSFFQQGLGIKYMLIEERLEGELLYSRFLFGKRTGAGESFDLGVRFLFGDR